MISTSDQVTEEQVATFRQDGAVLLPGIFTDWVEILAAGIERNLSEPGPHASENTQDSEAGRFFDDYCNWQRFPEFSRFANSAKVGAAAAQLMRSENVQLFHDHVLIKEPGTAKPTPWHQDSPYYFVEGEQTVSFWLPLDPVKEATLRLVAGSHKWPKLVLPTRWLSDEYFYASEQDYIAVPDPDAEPQDYRVLEWQMRPGDAVAFHFRTLHGARGNRSEDRRRAFSLRLVGDDARYVERPGPTSPPFFGHDMSAGEKLRPDWFPAIWPA